MNNEIGGSMTDKMVDVGGRRRPAWSTSAADIVGHQADVGRRHFFFQFSDTHTNVRRRRPECRRVSASVVRRRRRECRRASVSADIVGPVFRTQGRRPTTLAVGVGGRRRRECRKTGPTTQADTQSVTLVSSMIIKSQSLAPK